MSSRFLPVLAAMLVAACSRSSTSTSGGGGPAAMAMPAGVTAELIAQGDSLFNNANPQPTPCARCHGAKGVGGQNGPSLVAGPWLHSSGAFEEIIATITNGVPRAQLKDPSRQFAMNPRAGRFTDPQIRAIAAYIWSISRAKTKS